MARFTVVEGTQFNFEGTVYGPGESFDADPDAPEVQAAVATGWVAPDEEPPKRARRK